jgi:hypothetical protein
VQWVGRCRRSCGRRGSFLSYRKRTAALGLLIMHIPGSMYDIIRLTASWYVCIDW